MFGYGPCFNRVKDSYRSLFVIIVYLESIFIECVMVNLHILQKVARLAFSKPRVHEIEKYY